MKTTKGAAGRKTVRSASGSRSASVVPGGTPAGDADVDKPEKQEEEAEEADNEDDKLYCLCKTKYDEGRVMIACDRYVILILLFSLSSNSDPCLCVCIGAMSGTTLNASNWQSSM